MFQARTALGFLSALLISSQAMSQETPRSPIEFHVGAFAGMMVFDSTITVGGIKLVDQGGDAVQGGIRAGISNTGPFHFGFEVEGFLASGRSRAVIPNRGVYSLDVSSGLGAFGRVGWRTPGNSVMFLRPGVMFLNTNAGWETVPAVGVGAEIPFARGWAARLDVTYAWGSEREYYNGTAGVVFRF